MSPSPSLSRSALVIGVAVLALSWILWWYGFRNGEGRYSSSPEDWDDRREKVKEAFISSWDAYSKYAWGQFPIFFPS
jgi:endoplasmic reticulum Man9GlcNAc2 1,2-alpha-mannosidase